jgi:hypothetical protein
VLQIGAATPREMRRSLPIRQKFMARRPDTRMDSEGVLLPVLARVEGDDGHDSDSGFSATVEPMAQSQA